MARNWIIKPHDESLVALIEKRAGVSPVIAQLLVLRGITDLPEIRRFLKADLNDLRPGHELPGVESAATEIIKSIDGGQPICVYGDYDADGMTATAILVRCIQLAGGQVDYYVPNRMDDGYGLNDQAIHQIADKGVKLIVTVDCGIASIDEAATAKSLGVKLIITDHHQMGGALPEAAAIVHPGLADQVDNALAGLCGAGVALKLAWRICQLATGSNKVGARHRQFLLTALGLAAIGTVADVVPLVGDNRLIVKHGLHFIKSQTVPGIQELLKLTKLDGNPTLSAEDIAFSLAPRLNAAGRLGQAQLGVELLTTDSPSRAEALAEYIHQLNESRDSLERKVFKAANQEIRSHKLDEQAAIVLAQRGWHAGVIGIVAGRMAEKYNRPTVMIAIDDLQNRPAMGSARTACGINLYEALRHCSQLLVSCGGHVQAAGLKIERQNIDAFRQEFISYANDHTTADARQPTLEVDAEVPLHHLTLETVENLEQLAPFGEANRRPVFCARDVQLADAPRKIGGGERHLALQIQQHSIRMRCVAFGQAEWADQLEPDQPFDVAFQPMINEFRGWRRVELRLLDWRLCQVAAAMK